LLSAPDREVLHATSDTIFVSARTGEGIPELLAAIDDRLTLDPIERVRLCFEPGEGKLLSAVYDCGRVLHREDAEDGVKLEAEIPRSLANQLRGNLTG
jgi:GTPase